MDFSVKSIDKVVFLDKLPAYQRQREAIKNLQLFPFNQNQAIFTLSQVSAILTPRQNAYLNKKSQKHHENASTFLCKLTLIQSMKITS
ncbi:hypothetical protein QE152_g587 [Popillia japonica]|uniref:Uncharacterized protein n=1 Tax=Popillia japonica TaxID=7064 RepID=A0AAW1NKK8_POPJA